MLAQELVVHAADATGLTLFLDFRDVGLGHLWAAGSRTLLDIVRVGETHYPLMVTFGFE